MNKNWLKEVEEAQKQKVIVIEGVKYDRISFENEEDLGSGGKCGDCGVSSGQYHVLGCDIEMCPKCKGQLISCDCEE